MIRYLLLVVFMATLFVSCSKSTDADKPKVAFSFDDGSTKNILNYDWQEWNGLIRKQLKENNVNAAWFVMSNAVDNEKGETLLQQWSDAGNLIANHTHSHYNYNSSKVNFDMFSNDILKCDSIINGYKNFTKLFRFPYLKAGKTVESRDSINNFLKQNDYKQGWVTIDASDWYVYSRLRKRLKEDPQADISAYRDYYLDHILGRAKYYNDLSLKINKRQIPHTLLLHLNLTSALFLNDLIERFKSEGWEITNYSDAIKDPIYSKMPDAMPAEQSLIWMMARETGEYEDILRYPGEDSKFEKENMDKLGL